MCFDQKMPFERVDDLPVVIQPQVGPLIWRDRLQQEDWNHEAIQFLSGESFCHDGEDSRLPNTTCATQQNMRGIGMLFDPQGQLLINARQVLMPHGDSLKGIQLCSGLSCQVCHLSDTPHSGEELPDQALRPSLAGLRWGAGPSSGTGRQWPHEWEALRDRVAAGATIVLRLPLLPRTERVVSH